MNNLASVLTSLGRYDEAKTLYQETLQLREEVLSKKHPDTLRSTYWISKLLLKRNQYEEAAVFCSRACNGLRISLGPKHPGTVVCMKTYSKILNRLRETRLAASYFQDILDVHTTVDYLTGAVSRTPVDLNTSADLAQYARH